MSWQKHRALGNPLRYAIIRTLLDDGGMTGTELYETTDYNCNRTTFMAAVRVLVRDGVVKCTVMPRHNYYSMVNPEGLGKAFDAMESVQP